MNPERERLLKGRSHTSGRNRSQALAGRSNTTSINALKSAIRNVSRVLDHDQNLPLKVRIEKERALAGYKQDLEKAQEGKGRQRMIKKYHMVRFFGQYFAKGVHSPSSLMMSCDLERQKATRTLKKLRTRLPSIERNSPQHEALETQIHDAEVDLNYTLYHPLTEKYVSLFPRQDTRTPEDGETPSGEVSARTCQHKPALWTVVENCMENGTLQALRDGKLQSTTAPAKALQSIAVKGAHPPFGSKKDVNRGIGSAVVLAADGQGNGSDDGFFEE
ncbi:MAG: hypothetical protein Q9182_003112 [Xanthomendoza sp. 2 TL-2023]